jgi:menaquinone-dependent protoporphyrinogen IX oxidase
MAERTQALVTFASRMDSTQEIAEVIRHELEAFGMQVTVAGQQQ